MSGTTLARSLRAGLPMPDILPILMPLLVAMLWLVAGPLWALAGLASCALLGAALASYVWTIGIVLVGRTCLDLFNEQIFYIGAMRVSAASVFSLVILVLIMASFLASKSGIHPSNSIRALGVIIAGSSLGTVVAYARFGEEGNAALRELVRLFVLAVWYVFLYERSRETGDAKPFLRAVTLGCLVPLAVGFWHLFAGIGILTTEFNRIYSTFVEPNAFGFYLVFLIMFFGARIRGGGGSISWMFMVLALFFLYNSYSRGAWITMIIAAPIFWLRVSRRWVLVLVALLLCGLVAYPLVSARLASVDYGDVLMESSTGVTSNSFSFRVLIWMRLLEMWLQHPFTGWGLESTHIINPIRAMKGGQGAAAHSDAVRYLVETGISGFLCYLYFLWTLGKGLYCRSKELRGHPLGYYAVAAFATFIAFVIQAFTVSEPMHQTIFLFHFLGLAAVLEGCADHMKHRTVFLKGGASP